MSFKTVLAMIGNTDPTADLARAMETAIELEAHLSVVVIGLAVPATMGDFPAGTVWLDQRDEDLRLLDGIRKQAAAACTTNGLSFDIDVIYSEGVFVGEEIHRRALYADVLVIGDGVRGDSVLTRKIVDGGVFEAGRPLLLAPKNLRTTLKPRRVLLAWNSRTEAARAAREALEMMTWAEEVHVVLVDPDSSYWVSGGEPGADVAAYLARHGINVVVEQLASGGRPVEDVLERHALEINADLIVMGAYGHSRLRERVFGGVTASILEKSKLPVLIAR
ncbi:universal stress protein [Neorhizobium sp. BETTINA12A]|uniref:universal stress protein n=1 Tax=Neorhizobium sp. BETTINA12A TaxID=2908924 RepID=UPI001FF43EF2|nr:universal stress protein [Neorhizobium sp. BETTINA12A]MCJ9750695.1 universal stress protein [Neorhizobium sp. BETTINA12A]